MGRDRHSLSWANMSKIEASKQLQQSDSDRFSGLESLLAAGKLVDFKLKGKWVVARISEVTATHVALRLRADQCDRDKTVHRGSERLAPFRSFTSQASEIPLFKEGFKFCPELIANLKHQVEEVARCGFDKFNSAQDLTQFISGELLAVVDSLLSFDQSVEDLPPSQIARIVTFMGAVFDLVLLWLRTMPGYQKSVHESQQYPMLSCFDIQAATVQCGRPLLEMLGMVLCPGPRHRACYEQFAQNSLQRALLQQFDQRHGFEVVRQMQPKIPIAYQALVLSKFTQMEDLTDHAFASEFYSCLASSLRHVFDNLTDLQLQITERQDLFMLLKLFVGFECPFNPVDRDLLLRSERFKLVKRRLQCPYSRVKVREITKLQKIAQNLQHGQSEALTYFKQTVISLGLVECIFTEGQSPEIIRRSTDLAILVASEAPSKLVRTIWGCMESNNQEVQQATMAVLSQVAQACPEEALTALVECIKSLAVRSVTKEHLCFLSNLVETFDLKDSQQLVEEGFEFLLGILFNSENPEIKKTATETMLGLCGKLKHSEKLFNQLGRCAMECIDQQSHVAESISLLRKLPISSKMLEQLFVSKNVWKSAVSGGDDAKEAGSFLVDMISKFPEECMKEVISHFASTLASQADGLSASERKNWLGIVRSFLDRFELTHIHDDLKRYSSSEIEQFECILDGQREYISVHLEMTFFQVLYHASLAFKRAIYEIELNANDGPLARQFYYSKVGQFIQERVTLHFSCRHLANDPRWLLAQDEAFVFALVNVARQDSSEEGLDIIMGLPLNQGLGERVDIQQLERSDWVSVEGLFQLKLLPKETAQKHASLLSQMSVQCCMPGLESDPLRMRILTVLLETLSQVDHQHVSCELFQANMFLIDASLSVQEKSRRSKLFKQAGEFMDKQLNKQPRLIQTSAAFLQTFQRVWLQEDLAPQWKELLFGIRRKVRFTFQELDRHLLACAFDLLAKLQSIPIDLMDFVKVIFLGSNTASEKDKILQQVSALYQQSAKGGSQSAPQFAQLANMVFKKHLPLKRERIELLQLTLSLSLTETCDKKSMMELVGTLIAEDQDLNQMFASTIGEAAMKSSAHWRKPEQWSIKSESATKRQANYGGLLNLGNTCYINSMLQQLFMTPHLRCLVLSSKPTGQQRVLSILRNLFAELMFSDASFIDTWEFVQEIFHALGDVGFNPAEQQDTYQFLNLVIDRLDQELRGTNLESQLRSALQGSCTHEVISCDCFHRSEREACEMTINLDIETTTSIEASLKQYVQAERLEGSNSYECEFCGCKRNALKRQSFNRLPNVLILRLNRLQFDFAGNASKKLNQFCEFPIELDMRPYSHEAIAQADLFAQMAEGSVHFETMTKEQQQILAKETVNDYFRYQLGGVVIHKGESGHGHYYSICRDRAADKWVCFDDSKVTDFDISDLAARAFGGEDPSLEKQRNQCAFDHQMLSSLEGQQLNSENAYVLVYERARPIDADHYESLVAKEIHGGKDPREASQRAFKAASVDFEQPNYNDVQLEVRDKLASRNVRATLFNESTLQLAAKALTYCVAVSDNDYNAAKSASLHTAQQSPDFTALRALSTYFLTVSVRAVHKADIVQFQEAMSKGLEQSFKLSIWLVENFSNHEVLEEFAGAHQGNATLVFELLRSAIEKVLPFEQAALRELADPRKLKEALREARLTQARGCQVYRFASLPAYFPSLLALASCLHTCRKRSEPIKQLLSLMQTTWGCECLAQTPPIEIYSLSLI